MRNLFIIIFLCIGLVYADTFYIDPTLGNDANAGTAPGAGNAWASFDGLRTYVAGTGINPGDSILIKRGERLADSLLIAFEGDASDYVYIGDYGTGDKPVIDASGLLLGFSMNSRDYLKLYNLRIVSPDEDGIKVWGTSSNIIIDSVDVDSSGNQAFQNEGTANTTYYNITGNYCTDDGFSMHDSSTATVHTGTFIGNADGVNIIFNAKFKGYDITILNTTSEALYATNENAGDSCVIDIEGLEVNTEGSQIGNNAGLYVKYGYFHGATTTEFIDTDEGTDGDDLHLQYCIFDTIDAGQFAVVARAGASVTIDNCVFIDDGDGRSLYDAAGGTINNNIFYGLDKGPWQATAALTAKNCMFYDVTDPVGGGTVTMTDTLNADPLFTDPDNSDFTLQATSPAIDAGVTITGLTRDYSGNAVPSGSATDIGAEEYQQASTEQQSGFTKFTDYKNWGKF